MYQRTDPPFIQEGPGALSPQAAHHPNILERDSETKEQLVLLLAKRGVMREPEGGLSLSRHSLGNLASLLP